MSSYNLKHIPNKPKRIVLFGTVFIVSLSIISLCIISSVGAQSVVGFDPGRIIDDVIFTNSNSMNAIQIQAFLNSKVPVCDTYGTQPSEYGGGTRAQWAANASLHPISGAFYPPFTCLKDYQENSLSAAQIIYNVAQMYQINPQVLIVLLQKEQGLVTDTWPAPYQYRAATGYGCPDTAPCDSQYYGLTAQLHWAGTLFHTVGINSQVWSNPYRSGTSWYSPYVLGSNYVQYSPNASCGGSTINIVNRSTVALYDYTPYQPNAAALAAGYGQGNSCSSHGNRNFYLYFTDWFGTVRSNDSLKPHPDGTLINIDNKIFLIKDNTLHYVKNAAIFESYDYMWGDVKPATIGDKALAFSYEIDHIKPGVLYASPGSDVYITVIENDAVTKKILSYISFVELGYKWSQIEFIPSYDMPVATSAGIYFGNTHPDGTLIKTDTGVFLIDGGKKRYVSPEVFTSNDWKWSNILEESDGDKLLELGARANLKHGSIVFDGNNLYAISVSSIDDTVTKNPIGPWECFESVFRYKLSDALFISSEILPQQTGPRISC